MLTTTQAQRPRRALHSRFFKERLLPAIKRLTLLCLLVCAPLPAAEILPAQQLKPLWQTAGALLTQFGNTQLTLGKMMQTQLKTSPEAARLSAQSRLQQATLDEADRARLVSELLASYELARAALHFTELSESARQQARLPAEVRLKLDAILSRMDEIHSLALPLAQRLKLKQLDAVDAHGDGLQIMAWPEDSQNKVFGHPLKQAIAKEPLFKAIDTRLLADNTQGDLQPFYHWLNSGEYLRGDIGKQWAPFLRMSDTDGYGKARLALWELRNQQIAANTAALSAQPGVKRVLVIYGIAHKPFLDAALTSLSHVQLRQWEELKPAKP